MKNLFKFPIIVLTLFFLLVFVKPTSALAVTAIENEQVKNVLDIGLYETKIVSQDGNIFKIAFDIANDEGPQAGLMYTVKLVKETTSGQFLADSYTADEVISIGAKSTISKEITYTAPANISGKYKIFVFLNNQSGLTAGLGSAGEVILVSTVDTVEIIPETCFLSVVDEKSKTKYNLLQGVDIAPSENLSLTCTVSNSSKRTINATPVYETHFRTVTGEIVPQNGGDVNPISFKAGEKKSISLVLSKATKPQSYDVKVSLKEGSNSSNFIVAHYVIRGASATIQRLSLDKDYYDNGDTANISLAWSGSADTFEGSRAGSGTNNSNITVLASMTNKNGSNCIDPINKNLDEITVRHAADISVPITAKCENPKVSVDLKDADGNVLDHKEFSFETTSNDLQAVSNTWKVLFIIIGVLIVVGLAAYFINLKKKSNETTITQ